MTERNILRSSVTSKTDVEDFFRIFWANELLVPSTRIWLVSPWISDVPVFDNGMGDFSGLCPSWPRRVIKLTDVIARLLELEVDITIATRSVSHNDERFLPKLAEMTAHGEAKTLLHIIQESQDQLHVKGFLTSKYFVSGSMNLTYGGMVVNDEYVSVNTDPQIVATARIKFREIYG